MLKWRASPEARRGGCYGAKVLRGVMTTAVIAFAAVGISAGCGNRDQRPSSDDDDDESTSGEPTGTSSPTCDGHTEASCGDACYWEVGLTEGSCNGDTCQCSGDFTDYACADGVAILCYCELVVISEGPYVCDYAEFDWDTYSACARGEYSVPSCLATYRQADGTVDCHAAFEGCFN
jgi:hypothetical protein